MAMTFIPPVAGGGGPRPPRISTWDLALQYKRDVFGKEVQSAATYSYMWLADQSGHVALGMILEFIVTLAGRHLLPLIGVAPVWANLVALVVVSLVVSAWEFLAFVASARQARGLFPLDVALLGYNAFTATLYMMLGAFLAFAFHFSGRWQIAGLLGALLVALIIAPYWMRQKMIWQKAALPYLFRLANAPPTIDPGIAQQLQAIIDGKVPPAAGTTPAQVIVGGPIGSGRTALAAGIGTEFAFKDVTVRYLSLSALLEFASLQSPAGSADDLGPTNINYWPWSTAQVVIIDDVGPLIAENHLSGKSSLGDFERILRDGLGPIRFILSQCHTVWVMGDLMPAGTTTMTDQTLGLFAQEIANFCGRKGPPLVVELK